MVTVVPLKEILRLFLEVEAKKLDRPTAKGRDRGGKSRLAAQLKFTATYIGDLIDAKKSSGVNVELLQRLVPKGKETSDLLGELYEFARTIETEVKLGKRTLSDVTPEIEAAMAVNVETKIRPPKKKRQPATERPRLPEGSGRSPSSRGTR